MTSHIYKLYNKEVYVVVSLQSITNWWVW